jgi:putative transposase
MAKRTSIVISKEILTELQTIARSTTAESRMVLRSKIILLWHQGLSFAETQSELGVSEVIINKWRSRFSEKGMDGLRDLPRSGKPPVITAAQKTQVINLATSKPGKGYINWSERRIAEATGMSQSKVHEILREADLKPHKTEYWCGKSTDPEFEQKMVNIIGLYMNPPENALVLSVDEKTQIQALDRSQPELPLRSGSPKRLTATYKRNGTVALMAALAVHSGEITAKTVERNNAENFLAFLKSLHRNNPGKELHVVLDNLAIHKHSSVKSWAEKTKRIHLHYTPTYSSWLNQIEIWFNIMSKDVLKGGVWKTKQQLIDQLMLYIKTYNSERAKPFKWTYTGKPLVA